MKKILNLQVLLALLLTAVAPLGAMADTILFNFTDTFTNGSTLNSATPANPTSTNTAYELVSSKAWNPNPPPFAANDLRFGIAATTSGYIEAEALFATNAVALVEPGDFIQLTVTFTNTSGLLTAAGQLGFGLYNSSQVKPVAGGINNTLGNTYTGNAQNWVGYVADINFTNAASRILTRPTQSATTGLNQDLITFGTSSSYGGSAVVGTATGNATLTAGGTYTEVLTITLNGTSSLAITNVLYAGPDTSGTVITNFGAVATNANFLTGGFDSLAIGYCGRANTGGAPLIDISSILVSASTTVITAPPTINPQPVAVTVATNGSCAFRVAAVGFDVTYQWHRNGTNLLNQDNISGATGSGASSLLVITNAGVNDALSSANGYYVTVSGAGGFSTNSVTNSLTLIAATNLIWNDNNPNNLWDLNNTVNWQDASANQLTFNYGDPVIFNDIGFGGTVVLTGQYLSAASVTVNSSISFPYNFTGSGSYAGPGNLIYEGAGQLNIGNANIYSGGTIISNALAHLVLQNYNGLGTGPVTLAKAGGIMEIPPGGSATLGVNGGIVSADDFTIWVDGTGSFAGIFLGDFSGTSGKTLTLIPNPINTTTNDRIRAFGANTIDNADLALNSPLITFASYNGSGSQTYNGVISGSGAFMQKGTITYFNNTNTYSGGTFPVSATIALGIDSVGNITSGPIGTGPLFLTVDSTTTLTGSGMLLASGGTRTIANPIQFTSGTNNLTLAIGGTNDLTLSGAFTLNGNDNITTNTFTARTVQVTNTGLTTLSGVISDLTNGVSAGYGFIKTGNGVLALNNTETYTGPTTVSGGTLRVNGSLNAASAVTVNSNATLSGTGTINGRVAGDTSGTIAAGAASIGTLAINNILTNNGNVFIRVNKSNSPGQSNDLISVSGVLTNTGTGTVTVTNLGPGLVSGDTFFLFNKALSNGAAMTVIGGKVAWNNNLAVNGSISVGLPPDTGVQLAGPSSVAPGANITNTITVTNIGPGTALGIVVTDSLPANVTFVSASSGGTTNANAGQVVWSGISLGVNTSSNLTLIFKAPAVGNVTNTASVVSSAVDPSPANNTATNVTIISTTIIPTVSARITSFSMVGGNVVINGTNGVTGGTYYLLDSTNVAQPLIQWTVVATNIVNTNGAANNPFTFTGTNVVTPNGAQQFYILSNTNNH